MTKKCGAMCRIMLLVLSLGAIGCAGFGLAYAKSGSGWALSASITCGMFAYHMLIRFLAPAILCAVTHRHYNPRGRWFSEKPWEKRLYRVLRVKRWKGRALTFDPGDFSLQAHTAEEVVNSMCHAEAVHELIIPLSMSSLLFAIPFGSLAAFLITALLAVAFDLSFVIIQRFNRPRLMRIADRRRA